MKHVFAKHGVETLAGQKHVLQGLLFDGVEISTFVSRRRTAKELRTAEGKPDNVDWIADIDLPEDE